MKQKKYTEKEIFKIIDEWAARERVIYPNSIPMKDIDKIAAQLHAGYKKLKQSFMTGPGFRKAIEDAGLVGTQFTRKVKA